MLSRKGRIVGAMVALVFYGAEVHAQGTPPPGPGCTPAVWNALVQTAQSGGAASIGRVRNTFTTPTAPTSLSCFSSILSLGQGFNLSFDLSSLAQGLLNQIENFACAALTQELNQVTGQFSASSFFASIPNSAPGLPGIGLPASLPLPPPISTPPLQPPPATANKGFFDLFR
jgi:hypothetical protein